MIQIGDRVNDLLENLGAGVVVSKGIVGCSEEGGSSLFIVDFGGAAPQERFSHEILPQRTETSSLAESAVQENA